MSAPIQNAWQEIQARIKKACDVSGRSSSEVEVVAVTKTFDAGVVRQAYDLGLRQFGENKVQELLDKKSSLPSDSCWHMIGRLQTNKVKMVLGQTVLIHSLDRTELFDKILNEAEKQKIGSVECLLQVNISGEATKAGFAPEQAALFLSQLKSALPIRIAGLMTMAPLTENRAEIRGVFRKARELFTEWKKEFPDNPWKHLSMGMSGDYEIAVEEGATLIRIGTALFGQREVSA
ncbi:MAG TPA: YggS family pyridoxal phosphate-dependent enzyme [Candidatus Omnitrophica bacterium]|nr:YggS family pyridoxal phosphate-dependent enzyme [Candidatus Omnitrophota bacterium]